MSKAILVLPEMPDVCVNCILCDIDNYCCETGKALNDRQTKRPEWCPLRPLPEKEQIYLESDEFDEGYMHGWNACIEAIEGSGE